MRHTASSFLLSTCQLTLQSQRWYRMRLEAQERSREHYLGMTLNWMGSKTCSKKQDWAGDRFEHNPMIIYSLHSWADSLACFHPIPLWCLPGNVWACLSSSTCPECLSKVLQTKLSLFWILYNPPLLPIRIDSAIQTPSLAFNHPIGHGQIPHFLIRKQPAELYCLHVISNTFKWKPKQTMMIMP